MSGVFFEELGIPKPDYNLGIGSGTHGRQTGAMLAAIEDVLDGERPDAVLVYGDTNSTLAGALAAAKLNIPVAHVEAGLRSFDRRMPEEVNRVLTDHCSEILFCPTETAVSNLAAEGIRNGVFLVGDVMVDAMNYNRGIAEERSRILEDVGVEPGDYLAVTVHRPSNTDSRESMAAILGALGEAGRPVVFPVHPRTRKFLGEYGLLGKIPGNVILTEPLGYLDMIRLMAHAEKILTDSGGIHPSLGVPVLVLRRTTERPEGIQSGNARLVGTECPAIRREAARLLQDAEHYRAMSQAASPYGDGQAARRTVEALLHRFGRQASRPEEFAPRT